MPQQKATLLDAAVAILLSGRQPDQYGCRQLTQDAILTHAPLVDGDDDDADGAIKSAVGDVVEVDVAAVYALTQLTD